MLARLAEERLGHEIIEMSLSAATAGSEPGIDKLLAKKAQEALRTINDMRLDEMANAEIPAENIIKLGIAASAKGPKVKAIFG